MIPLDALSFQLYSARSLASPEEQFDLLAGLGYRMVEPYGAFLDDPDRFKRLLERYRMTAPTAHIGLDRLRADARAVARQCRELGIGFAFAPAPPPDERDKDAAGWRSLGRELAGIGAVLAREDVRFGWHNHHFEYRRCADGSLPLDLILEAAPDLLWEADLAWIARGGADPVSELHRLRDRVVACHIKDIAPAGEAMDEDGWADLGHGTLDWGKLLTAMRAADARYLVAEHDKPNDVARFARRARETVASWR